MPNFCPKCGAPLAGVSAEAKFCPKCGAVLAAYAAPVDAPVAAPTPAAPAQPVSAAPAKPSAVYLFDLPSRLHYIIAMVCLAVSVVVSMLLSAECDVEEPSAGKMAIFAILNAAAMLYSCIVINKMLSYKRSALGLWATRVVYAMYAVMGFLPLCIYVGADMCMTPDDIMTLLSQIKTAVICLSIVYTASFATLGFAIIDLKDHAKGGRWFMATGAALILVTALSFISDMYDVVNFEEVMMNDESSSWAIPWPSIVLLVLFIGGYMFLAEDNVRGRYGRVEDNSAESYGGGGILLLALWRGVFVLRIWVLFIAPIVLIAWVCSMIKYAALPEAGVSDAPNEGNAEVAKMLAEDGDATMKKWLLIGAGVIVLLVLWLM